MHADPLDTDQAPEHGDARDAVTGPVGSARLVEPSSIDTPDAGLDTLTPIDDPDVNVPGDPG